MCTHEETVREAVMGANSGLNHRKCQQYRKFSELWEENERFPERHGCTQIVNQSHSPTPRSTPRNSRE